MRLDQIREREEALWDEARSHMSTFVDQVLENQGWIEEEVRSNPTRAMIRDRERMFQEFLAQDDSGELRRNHAALIDRLLEIVQVTLARKRLERAGGQGGQ